MVVALRRYTKSQFQIDSEERHYMYVWFESMASNIRARIIMSPYALVTVYIALHIQQTEA